MAKGLKPFTKKLHEAVCGAAAISAAAPILYIKAILTFGYYD